MKLIVMSAAVAGIAATQLTITDIRDIKKSALLADLAIEATDELNEHMDLDGLDISYYMDEALGVYRSDFPDAASRMDVEAQNMYTFKENTGVQRNDAAAGLTVMDKIHIMKYLQLKFATLYLQKNKFLGKYCFYGCWCFPRAAGAEHSGYGVPVDNIDKSCREYTTCFNCIFNQKLMGQRCNEWTNERYNIGGFKDPKTGEVTLFCKDPHGSCLRSRCECDLDLAKKLRDHEDEWNPNNHHKWGTPPFEPKRTCGMNIGHFFQDEPSKADTAGLDEETNRYQTNNIKEGKQVVSAEFQAANPHDFPGISQDSKNDFSYDDSSDYQSSPMTTARPFFSTAPIYGHIIGCCGRAPKVHYFRKGQRCCLDGEIVDEKAPCSAEFTF